MIIKEKTYIDQNDEFADRAARAIRHSIIALNQVYKDFWGREPQKIVDSLNSNIPVSLERFHENTDTGAFLNIKAAKLGIKERVTVVMPKNYNFDSESMVFTYTIPPAPVFVEPEPVEPIE